MCGTHYSGLIAWQRALDLTEAVYVGTQSMPKDERFGLTRQLRRAAASIPANIAEGQARKVNAVFRNHASIALGSVAELETHLLLAKRLKFITPESAQCLLAQAAEVGRLVSGLHRSLQ